MSGASPQPNSSSSSSYKFQAEFEYLLFVALDGNWICKKTVRVRCSVKTAKSLKWFSNLAENLANYGQFYRSITLFSVNQADSTRQTPLILASHWSDLRNMRTLIGQGLPKTKPYSLRKMCQKPKSRQQWHNQITLIQHEIWLLKTLSVIDFKHLVLRQNLTTGSSMCEAELPKTIQDVKCYMVLSDQTVRRWIWQMVSLIPPLSSGVMIMNDSISIMTGVW